MFKLAKQEHLRIHAYSQFGRKHKEQLHSKTEYNEVNSVSIIYVTIQKWM